MLRLHLSGQSPGPWEPNDRSPSAQVQDDARANRQRQAPRNMSLYESREHQYLKFKLLGLIGCHFEVYKGMKVTVRLLKEGNWKEKMRVYVACA